jgi:hypothetical protein
MQFWIYFDAGDGGDGFANLLEHSDNVMTIDHNECVHASPDKELWRVDKFVNNRPKFWAPLPDLNGCFRNKVRFDQSKNELTLNYINAVNNKKYHTIVTSHEYELTHVDEHDTSDIILHDHVKVLIKSTNSKKSLENYLTKNLVEYDKKLLTVKEKAYKDSLFDYVFIDSELQNWTKVNQFCTEFGLDLDQKYHNEYLSIQNGKTHNSTLYSNTTPTYISIANGTSVSYEKIELYKSS